MAAPAATTSASTSRWRCSPSPQIAVCHFGLFRDLTHTLPSLRANVHAALERQLGGVDVFVHTWNPHAAALVDGAYSPYLRASLHQPVEYCDKEKPRSQALSIGRAADLMEAHERARGGGRYALCLVLRLDLLVGAPILLGTLDPEPQLINTNALPFRKGLEDRTDRHLQANLKIHNFPVAADS